jgi:hypothetical protein
MLLTLRALLAVPPPGNHPLAGRCVPWYQHAIQDLQGGDVADPLPSARARHERWLVLDSIGAGLALLAHGHEGGAVDLIAPRPPRNHHLGPHRAWWVSALRDARAVEVDLPATDPAPPEGRRPDHGEMVALEAVFVQLAVSRAQAVGVPTAVKGFHLRTYGCGGR